MATMIHEHEVTGIDENQVGLMKNQILWVKNSSIKHRAVTMSALSPEANIHFGRYLSLVHFSDGPIWSDSHSQGGHMVTWSGTL